MKSPTPLKRGDLVRIMSPSGPVNKERLLFGISVLESWGLVVDVDPQSFLKKRYLAGTDDERRHALQRAIDDPKIKGVFFSRGGFGLSRIVSDLNFEKLHKSPKWFVGFSDITALLLSLFQQRIGGALHGPVVASFSSQSESLPALEKILFGKEPTKASKMTGELFGSKSDSSGPLWGGNLSIVVAELATGEVSVPEHSIVFLEDVGESDYRLDRLLTVFARAAKNANVEAVLFGTFNDCAGSYVEESEMLEYINELAGELARRLDCAVLTGLPFGHTAENMSLSLGATASVNGNEVHVMEPR